MTYWSAHTHTRYSSKDALPTVEAMVATAVELGYPALGLTDHGVMRRLGRAVHLLPQGRRHRASTWGRGLRRARPDQGQAAGTMHLGMLATTEAGYRNLVGLVTSPTASSGTSRAWTWPTWPRPAPTGAWPGWPPCPGAGSGCCPRMLREGDPVAVRNLLVALDGWFDQLYVELQHHNIVDDEHDDPRHVALLHASPTSLGLPVVITQDSHYCQPGDRAVHETMKRLCQLVRRPRRRGLPRRRLPHGRRRPG